jgi:AcrR family transcriptional regulator
VKRDHVVSSLQHGDCQALVEAVIDAAGDTERISPSDIAHCFGSADELVAAAYSQAARILLDRMTEGLTGPGPWLTRWERAVRAVVSTIRRRPGLAGLTLSELEGRSDAIRDRSLVFRREYIDVLASEYARERAFADVPDLHVELMAGAAYRAYVAEAVAGRLTDPRVDVVPKLVNVIAMLEPVAA